MTDEERQQIYQIAMDLESGNHLLRPRSAEYRTLLREVAVAIDTPEENRSQRQKELVEEYNSNFYN